MLDYVARAKHALRHLSLAIARLRYPLASGLTAEVRDHSDWIIYNDIFVLGEYDMAITRLLAKPSQEPLRVLDLGANVGFFTLRLADRILSGGAPRGFSIIAVEGAPKTFRELRRRMGREPALAARCQCVLGLAGRRSGLATISDPGFSARGAVGSGKGRESKFLDLAELNAGQRIDLLKCDIEGSEFEFLREYERDLLTLTDAAILEFHGDPEIMEEGQAILHRAGLSQQVVVRQRGGTRLVACARPAPPLDLG